MAEGWISIHRKIQDNEIWTSLEPFDRRSAWIDLLMLANHEDKQILMNYQTVTIKRGQCLTSVRKLGERWRWGKDRVLKYLKLLESLKMVQRISTKQQTLLTIENYGKYQICQDTGKDTEQTQNRHGSATNNNENNENNNIYIDNISTHFSEFWKCYPKKTEKGNAYKCYKARLNDGFSEDELLTACKNYAEECKRENREKRYIKNGSTFLSATTPFVDYLKKGDEKDDTGMGETSSGYEERAEEIRRYLESDEFRNAEDDSLF